MNKSYAHPGHSKNLEDISRQWDRIADERHRQISQGLDLSYKYILLPTILDLVGDGCIDAAIDVGTGVGHTAAEISLKAKEVVAVDISARSIEIAAREYGHVRNLRFFRTSIEQYAQEHPDRHFTLALANMTLMDALSLNGMVQAIQQVLRPNAQLVFTITHPWFWPVYGGYADASWFEYQREIVIEAPFRISLEDQPGLFTTHIHRPLSMYMEAFHAAGLHIEQLLEPTPEPSIMKLYPHAWAYPRFLAGLCRLGP